VHERNDGIIALRHGFGKGIIVIPRYVALNVRLAGKNLIAARFQDVRKQDGRAFARIVDVGLEAHAEHGDLRAGLHVARDAVRRPGGLAVVDKTGLVDERRDILELFMDEPRVDRDAVSADADAGGMHVHSGVAVGKFNQFEHVDAEPVADLAELVGIGDIDIAERVFRQLAHLGSQIIRQADRAAGDDLFIDFLGELRRFRTVRADDAIVLAQLDEHPAGDDALRAVRRHELLRRKAGRFRDDLLHHARGIGRRGGFEHAEVPRAQDGTDLLRGGFDEAHIGHALVLLRLAVGRLDADDKDVGRFRLRRKVQAAGLRHGVLQAGFYNMDMARVQRVHDGILYVEAADLIARQRKRDSGGEADIAAAHDLDFFHAFSLLCMQTYKDTISYFLRFCKQSLHHIRLFPRQIQFRAAKVAVTGGLTVDRAAQIERLDDGRRAQVEAFAHKLGQLVVGQLAGSICLDENGNRVRHADGVGQLQLAGVG